MCIRDRQNRTSDGGGVRRFAAAVRRPVLRRILDGGRRQRRRGGRAGHADLAGTRRDVDGPLAVRRPSRRSAAAAAVLRRVDRVCRRRRRLLHAGSGGDCPRRLARRDHPQRRSDLAVQGDPPRKRPIPCYRSQQITPPHIVSHNGAKSAIVCDESVIRHIVRCQPVGVFIPHVVANQLMAAYTSKHQLVTPVAILQGKRFFFWKYMYTVKQCELKYFNVLR